MDPYASSSTIASLKCPSVNDRGRIDLYHAPVELRLVSSTEICGSSASAITPKNSSPTPTPTRNGSAAKIACQPLSCRGPDAIDAFVVAASYPRPRTILPKKY